MALVKVSSFSKPIVSVLEEVLITQLVDIRHRLPE